MHDAHLQKVMQLCLLDTKSQELKEYIMQIVDISKEFRLLIKQYLISRDEVDLESDDESISSEGIKKYDGMGILRFSSDTYIEDLAKCQASLVKLREKFEKHIKILSTNLNKLTKT